MYNMKRMTASEVRQNWFRVLDEVLAGEVVAIERKGQRVVLRLEAEVSEMEHLPDYGALLQVPGLEAADAWGWDWNADTGEVEAIDEDRS